MVPGGCLTVPEKATIISELAKGNTTLEIFEILDRYHGTVKKFVAAPDAVRSRVDRGSLRTVSRRTLCRVKLEVTTNPCLTNNEFFRHVGEYTVSKCSTYFILKTAAQRLKPFEMPPLRQIHEENRLKCTNLISLR